MPDDRLYDDADVEAAGDLLQDRIESLGMSYEAAAGELLWQLTVPAAGSPLLARHRAQVAEEIAQAIEDATDTTCGCGCSCYEVAREVGGTTAEDGNDG